ncbi:hypothetical protein HZH66_005830 [Vespula vulgaris]|uniref:Uncharacterized protein n=1 Tax=Vespula vulgaris TaxID=7454 RepID=A0A834K7I5_VESVU|nr:hypothetical protein HZH66_005830 [Vespula vulgaris]
MRRRSRGVGEGWRTVGGELEYGFLAAIAATVEKAELDRSNEYQTAGYLPLNASLERDRLRERERQARAAMSVQAEQAAAGGSSDPRHHHHSHHSHAHHHANAHSSASLFRAPVKFLILVSKLPSTFLRNQSGNTWSWSAGSLGSTDFNPEFVDKRESTTPAAVLRVYEETPYDRYGDDNVKEDNDDDNDDDDDDDDDDDEDVRMTFRILPLTLSRVQQSTPSGLRNPDLSVSLYAG